MNSDTVLVITSISSPNRILRTYAEECAKRGMRFIVVGDAKSPSDFAMANCDFWSLDRQKQSDFGLATKLPENHYARKNIGYLLALKKRPDVIIETDDDNLPQDGFWEERKLRSEARLLVGQGWVNVYKYFTSMNIWPRGFPLEHVWNDIPSVDTVEAQEAMCPVQQGLSDGNPDVDAIYRLAMPLPVRFGASKSVALGKGSWCPFNSQNTTWFKAAFPLLYLPSYCSFRMTDIWRSYIAQRIFWECNWQVLYHNATVCQKRNKHDLMQDFRDELDGYLNNDGMCEELSEVGLKRGPENILENLIICYRRLVETGYLDKRELPVVETWIRDFETIDVA